MCGANSKRAKNKGVTKSPGKIFWLVTEQIFFSLHGKWSRGHILTKDTQRHTPGTPRNCGFWGSVRALNTEGGGRNP